MWGFHNCFYDIIRAEQHADGSFNRPKRFYPCAINCNSNLGNFFFLVFEFIIGVNIMLADVWGGGLLLVSFS